MENERQTRTMCPCIWVNPIKGCIYWPPKGKPLGAYIADWSIPGNNWKCLKVIKTILESGTKNEADQMMRMPSTTESSDSDEDNR